MKITECITRVDKDELRYEVVRKRKSIQQNLDARARPIPGRANPNDDVER